MVTYQRARWKHWVRYFGLTIMVFLNISMIMSNLELHYRHRPLALGQELASYGIVFFFDLAILMPLIFEVDTVRITSDRVILSTLLWRAKLRWEEIVAFNNPIWLAFAVLRTRSCFYLINKHDVGPWDELLQTICFKTGRPAN